MKLNGGTIQAAKASLLKQGPLSFIIINNINFSEYWFQVVIVMFLFEYLFDS